MLPPFGPSPTLAAKIKLLFQHNTEQGKIGITRISSGVYGILAKEAPEIPEVLQGNAFSPIRILGGPVMNQESMGVYSLHLRFVCLNGQVKAFLVRLPPRHRCLMWRITSEVLAFLWQRYPIFMIHPVVTCLPQTSVLSLEWAAPVPQPLAARLTTCVAYIAHCTLLLPTPECDENENHEFLMSICPPFINQNLE